MTNQRIGKILFTSGMIPIMISSCNPQGNESNGTETPKSVSKPNILFILADDMGYGDISALNTASAIQTPHLDRMCQEGMRFTEAHAGSAVSTPSRYGMMTGQYSFRGPCKSGVLGGYSEPIIETTRPTVASILKSAGYRTAIFGKWHLGLGWVTKDGNSASNDNVDFTKPLTYTPNDVGFDRSCILPASLDMCPYVCVSDRTVEDTDMVDEPGVYPASYRGHMWRPGKRSSSFYIQNTLTFFTERAKNYLRSYAHSSKPFFLYMPLTAPHTPWMPTAEYKGKSNAGDYGDFVLNVDDVVGQMMDLLDSLGVLEKTVVVFASDNGADWSASDKKDYPHLANYIWRGRKSDLWDGGHHIPLIFRYPSLVQKAKASDALICLTDPVATFAEIGEATVPVAACRDSKSFVSVLNGKSAKGLRTEVIHQSNDGSLAIRQGRWKYVDCSGSGGWSQSHSSTLPQCQLYDMVSDPGETENLYNKYPDKTEELKNLLDSLK